MTASPWAGGRGPLRFLPTLLFADRQPAAVILVAFVLTIAGSFLLGLAVTWLVPEGAGPDLGKAPPVVLLVGLALVSPLVETLLMGGMLDVMRRWTGAWQSALASAAIWGMVHSLLATWWGVVIWWPFLIFSVVWIGWRARGFWTATLMVTTVHALQNLGPSVLIALDA